MPVFLMSCVSSVVVNTYPIFVSGSSGLIFPCTIIDLRKGISGGPAGSLSHPFRRYPCPMTFDYLSMAMI